MNIYLYRSFFLVEIIDLSSADHTSTDTCTFSESMSPSIVKIDSKRDTVSYITDRRSSITKEDEASEKLNVQPCNETKTYEEFASQCPDTLDLSPSIIDPKKDNTLFRSRNIWQGIKPATEDSSTVVRSDGKIDNANPLPNLSSNLDSAPEFQVVSKTTVAPTRGSDCKRFHGSLGHSLVDQKTDSLQNQVDSDDSLLPPSPVQYYDWTEKQPKPCLDISPGSLTDSTSKPTQSHTYTGKTNHIFENKLDTVDSLAPPSPLKYTQWPERPSEGLFAVNSKDSTNVGAKTWRDEESIRRYSADAANDIDDLPIPPSPVKYTEWTERPLGLLSPSCQHAEFDNNTAQVCKHIDHETTGTDKLIPPSPVKYTECTEVNMQHSPSSPSQIASTPCKKILKLTCKATKKTCKLEGEDSDQFPEPPSPVRYLEWTERTPFKDLKKGSDISVTCSNALNNELSPSKDITIIGASMSDSEYIKPNSCVDSLETERFKGNQNNCRQSTMSPSLKSNEGEKFLERCAAKDRINQNNHSLVIGTSSDSIDDIVLPSPIKLTQWTQNAVKERNRSKRYVVILTEDDNFYGTSHMRPISCKETKTKTSKNGSNQERIADRNDSSEQKSSLIDDQFWYS